MPFSPKNGTVVYIHLVPAPVLYVQAGDLHLFFYFVDVRFLRRTSAALQARRRAVRRRATEGIFRVKRSALTVDKARDQAIARADGRDRLELRGFRIEHAVRASQHRAVAAKADDYVFHTAVIKFPRDIRRGGDIFDLLARVMFRFVFIRFDEPGFKFEQIVERERAGVYHDLRARGLYFG